MAVKVGEKKIEQMATRTERRLSMWWAVAPLFLLDAACIAISMVSAYRLRFYVLEYYADFSPAFYARLVILSIIMWETIFVFHRLYHPARLFSGQKEYASLVNACTSGTVGLILYSFLDRSIESAISRGWLAIVWLFAIISLGSTRFLYRRWIRYLRRHGFFVRRALIIGANEEGEEVAAQLRASPSGGIQILGFVDPAFATGTKIRGIPVLGSASELGSLVRRLGVEELILIPTALGRQELLEIYRDWAETDHVNISLSSGLYELFTTGVQVQEVGFVPLLSVNRTRITGVDALVKSVVDFGVAIMGLVILSPVLLLIAILVRLDSPGPVIHRRRVIGLGGKPFDAYKFRSMILDADAYLEAHPELLEQWERDGKVDNDPRITQVGRFLRRFSLDELPQLFNVLKGEMSLVGPRMLTPAELRHFGRWKHNLLTVKPGITGLWQVSGRSDLAYEDRVRLDMQYIRNHTLWLDLKLLVNTVSTVISGRGAY